MGRLRLCVLSALLQIASSANLKVDVTWNGDYKQLLHRLNQAYDLSQKVYKRSRILYFQCHEQCQDLYLRFKEAQEEREFQHLYPFLSPVPSSTSISPDQANLPCQPPVTRGGQQLGGDSSGNLQKAIALGMVLAFNSGYINGCCLSGVTMHKQGVAAVTGAYTNSALGLASGNLSQFSTQLQVLLAYIFGSFVAGYLNPRPIAMDFSQSRQPALLIAGALLAGSSILASRDGVSNTYTYFLLAAMANGLQNSVTSSTTANLCRTTHYTGMSSDIGTFVGQMARGNNANASRLKVFLSLAAAFWSGGVISYFAVRQYEGWSLLLGAAIYFFVGSGLFQDLFLTKQSVPKVAPPLPPEGRIVIPTSLPPPQSTLVVPKKGSLQSLAV